MLTGLRSKDGLRASRRRRAREARQYPVSATTIKRATRERVMVATRGIIGADVVPASTEEEEGVAELGDVGEGGMNAGDGRSGRDVLTLDGAPWSTGMGMDGDGGAGLTRETAVEDALAGAGLRVMVTVGMETVAVGLDAGVWEVGTMTRGVEDGGMVVDVGVDDDGGVDGSAPGMDDAAGVPGVVELDNASILAQASHCPAHYRDLLYKTIQTCCLNKMAMA
ncbi:hypothetical protein HK101_011975 [Irineochytrium annulatum]|nr:hypothetical protein HK101_011975 [Irineochytrium annulatum]